MPFPFERIIEHRVFPNTFLRRVLIYVSFEKKGADFFDGNFKKKFQDYLSSMFNIADTGKFPQEALELKNDRGETEIVLSNGSFLICLYQKDYKSFIDSVTPYLLRLRVFAEQIMQSNGYGELRIRKVNIWRFESDNGIGLTYDLTSQAIFSKDLLQANNQVPLSKDEKSLPINQKLTWEDGSEKIVVLTGFAKLKGNAANLILDSEIIETAEVAKKEMMDAVMQMNGTLFDVYHWSINDNVRHLMDLKKE